MDTIPSLESWSDLKGNVSRQLYTILEKTGCGPFDGGCVLIAGAIQNVLGGDIVVLVNEDDVAEHAAVRIEDHLIDWDGPLQEGAFIGRFNRSELNKVERVRCFVPEKDLVDCPKDSGVQQEVASLIQGCVPSVGDVRY